MKRRDVEAENNFKAHYVLLSQLMQRSQHTIVFDFSGKNVV